MRKARSVAWFSTAGFHQRSKWKTWFAAVRFSPVPPALSDRRKTRGPVGLGSGTAPPSGRAGFAATPPWRNSTSRPNVSCRCVWRMSPISANWVKISARSPACSDLLQHLRQPGQLAGAAGIAELSPRNWAGWLQTCLSFVSVARTMPLRWMPSALSRSLGQRPRPRRRRATPAPGQVAEDLHLQLVGQVGDDALVGLEPAQDERAGQALQPLGGLGVALAWIGTKKVRRNSAWRAEQAGIEELHDRPEVADVVLDRRAGQGDAVAGLQSRGPPCACLVSGFLMFWASSRTTPAQSTFLNSSRSRCSSDSWRAPGRAAAAS